MDELSAVEIRAFQANAEMALEDQNPELVLLAHHITRLLAALEAAEAEAAEHQESNTVLKKRLLDAVDQRVKAEVREAGLRKALEQIRDTCSNCNGTGQKKGWNSSGYVTVSCGLCQVARTALDGAQGEPE
jgi:hypothetical protein